MTCIVALKDGEDIWFGGDSAATDFGSLNRSQISFPKVFSKRTPEGDVALFGFSGSFKIGQLLKYRFIFPERTKNCEDDLEYLTCAFSETLRGVLNDAGFLSTDDDATHHIGNSEFLLAYRGNIYMVFGSFEILHVTDPFNASGSGSDFALGSLHTTEELSRIKPKDRCLLALQTAEKYNAGVKAPFTIVSLKEEEKKFKKKQKKLDKENKPTGADEDFFDGKIGFK